MPTYFSSFSFPITAHFSLIFELIMDQVCLLYPFLRSIHFQILMLPEISMLQGTFSPGYLGESTLTLRKNFRKPSISVNSRETAAFEVLKHTNGVVALFQIHLKTSENNLYFFFNIIYSKSFNFVNILGLVTSSIIIFIPL